MNAPVLVAEAPSGTPATRVPARTRQDLDVVALVAPIGYRAHHDLPLDLLAELGKRDDVAGRRSHTQDHAALATIWLRAHQTTWAVVTSPHTLPVPALQFLATITLPAGTDLLLACDHGTAAQTLDGLADYGASQVAWNDVPTLVPPPDPGGPAPDRRPEQAWTAWDLTLPREDWTTFRSECRRLLAPQTFAQVDTVYQQAYRTTRDWLRSNEPTEGTTAVLVGRVLGAAGDLDRTVAALRGCQAAHMAAGWLLQADLDQAIGAMTQRPVPLTDAQWRSLRGYTDPHRAAVVTLHEHGLTVTDMLRIPLAAVTVDGSRVGDTDVDPRGRAYVRALALHRRADGAKDDDPLVPDAPRKAVNAIRDARDDLSLRLGPGRLSNKEHNADRWQRRLGIRLLDLR